MPAYYAERVRRMMRLVRDHSIVHDGDRIIELGTGWLHWEALTLRLFFDVEAVLFDVWDNRQLLGLKNYLEQLGRQLGNFDLSSHQVQRAQGLIRAVQAVPSFDALYDLLSFRYVVDPDGSLDNLSDERFSLVVSAGMLEHVRRDAVPRLIAQTRKILKPGGWAVHSIDTSDHFSHYDATVPPKKYLAFTDHQWRLLFDNDILYINRIQRGEWLELFAANGFRLTDEDGTRSDISALRLAPQYLRMDKQDLERTLLRFAFRTSEDSQ